MTNGAPIERFQLHQSGGVSVIQLSLPAAVDSTEFDALIEALTSAISAADSTRWVVDLAGVEYTGSAILGLLVNLRHTINAYRGQLVLCCVSPRFAQVIRTTSLQRMFTITRTRPEAMDLLT